MKKILIFSLIITILSSCSFFKKETDFTKLYKANVVSTLEGVEHFSRLVGYKRQESVQGAIKAALQIPILMSGSLVSEYKTEINNSDMNALLTNMKMAFETPINSGSLSAKRIGLTSITGDMYLLMEDFVDVGLFPVEAHDIFAKYNNTWLSYTQKDVDRAMSGASAEDMMVSTIAKNISKMGTKDIESYLTEYPIWKSTATLDMSGSLQRFAIDMDRDNVLSLVKKIMLDVSGSGMTNDSETALREKLNSFAFSGVLGFDTKDAHNSELDLNISQSGTLLAHVVTSISPSKTEFHISSVEDKTDMSLVITHDKDRSDIVVKITQDGTEIGQLSGYVVQEKDTLKELSLDITANGISVGLNHNLKEDGSFEGRLTLPVGAVSWNGKMEDKKLMALSLKGAMPMGSIDMNLVPTGDMLQGPLVVKNGSDEILRANIGLKIQEGIFGLDLAIINPEGGEPSLKTNIEITHTSKKFDDKILPPSPSKPLQDLVDELEKILPQSDDSLPEDIDFKDIENLDEGSGESMNTGSSN